jgi:hypothetical protein
MLAQQFVAGVDAGGLNARRRGHARERLVHGIEGLGLRGEHESLQHLARPRRRRSVRGLPRAVPAEQEDRLQVPLRQSSGLVDAHNRRGAEGLDGCQLPDERPPTSQPKRAEREEQGEHHRELFRHRRHGEHEPAEEGTRPGEPAQSLRRDDGDAEERAIGGAPAGAGA